MELTTELIIGASPEVVWSVLTDFASYPEWNPFIVEIAGDATAGARLRVRIVPPGTTGIAMRPTVMVAEPARELRWKGSLALAGLFSGEHSFVIEPHENGVRFVQSETFSGLLVPFFRRSLETSTRRGFEEMNRALRDRAEALAGDDATPEAG